MAKDAGRFGRFTVAVAAGICSLGKIDMER